MKPQLFFLHFAGGSRYSYNFLLPFLSRFNINCLELPGRGKRLNEELIREFDSAVDDYFAQIIQKIDAPYFGIYGHSMGAALMLRLVDRLEQAGRCPFYVFVSGNPGPGVIKGKKRHLLSKSDFKKELIDYGGMPQGLMEDEELFDFFEPVLRADFEIVEKSGGIEGPIISTPILVMMGNEELGAEQMQNWRLYTRRDLLYKTFKGGHFFIYNNAKSIADLINQCYDRTVMSQVV